MHLKWIIITFKNIYLAHKFLWGFIQCNTRSAFSWKFWKNWDYSAPYQAILSKTILMPSSKLSILHAKFRMITCNRIRDRTITRILQKTEYRDIYTQIASMLFLMIYIMYLKFCAISSTEISLSQKFRKSVTTVPPVERFSPKIYRNQFMLEYH